jgi:glycosyltransferase involved in cell wall biosynthesis
MIYFSPNKKSYFHFDWESYKKNYYILSTQGYSTKDEFWWHYVHIGEQSGFIYFDIKNKNFNNEIIINKSNTTNSVDIIPEIIKISPRKTLYYYVDFVSKHTNRTGIQVVTIYLAKQFLKCQEEFYLDIIFIKWNNELFCLEPCNKEDIDYMFNYNELSDIIPPITYDNYLPIHLNNYRPLSSCLFFCPELTFPIYPDLPIKLKHYIDTYKLKTIYILYDIIPLILGEYNCIREGFKTYMTNNLLKADKIITISNFTKTEFIQYCQQNNLYNFNFPIIESIPLPHQYRSKQIEVNIKNDSIDNKIINKTNDKITILIPGTVEPRKQQLKLLKICNSFIQNNPSLNLQIKLFGNILRILEEEVNIEINKSNNKIQYIGVVNNDELNNLYKEATFSCFISQYEGFGFPIAESLWHGTPVLTSNFGSMLEISNCGGCYSINSHNENEIYDALENLIKKPEIIQKLKSEINKNKFTTWYEYCKNIYIEILKILN